MKLTLNKLLHEPLLHFLFCGAILFGLYALIKNSDIESENGKRIEVTASDIDRLRENWTRQWKRPPNEEQLRQLIDGFVRQEVWYREALALGLDRNDHIVRRRLVQKMEFLSKDLALMQDPIEDDIAEYFSDNRERYRQPERISFTHVYFNPDQRGKAAAQDARNALARLRTEVGRESVPPRESGDPFMLQYDYSDQSPAAVRQLFGQGFARELFAYKAGAWQGPVTSSYGLHLVRVRKRTPSRLPEVSEIRNKVRRDLMTERLKQANDSTFTRLRNRYEVVINATEKQTTKFEKHSKE